MEFPKYASLAIIWLATCLAAHRVAAGVHSVHTFNNLGQLVTSSTLVWEPYNAKLTQAEFAIQGGKFITEEQHYPIFICRVYKEGVYVSGYTEKQSQRYVCRVSNLKQVEIHKDFDLLMNKGHFGKVEWQPWRKFSPPPAGAVSIAELSYSTRVSMGYFVARHSVENAIAKEDGPDYNIGRLDTTIGLGKILVIEKATEKEFTEGQVLVELEPMRYELHNIALNKSDTSVSVNITELDSTVLRNTEEQFGLIEKIVTYCYNKIENWGSHDGVAKGLPTKVFEGESTSSVWWGLKYSENRCETKTVSTNLAPGTAINITLNGDYTTEEAGYDAKLIIYYSESNETFSRKISSSVKRSTLRNVKLEFSPTYWSANGTIIPTLTTTTEANKAQPRNNDAAKVIDNSVSVASISKASQSPSAGNSTNTTVDESPANNLIRNKNSEEANVTSNACYLSLPIFIKIISILVIINM